MLTHREELELRRLHEEVRACQLGYYLAGMLAAACAASAFFFERHALLNVAAFETAVAFVFLVLWLRLRDRARALEAFR